MITRWLAFIFGMVALLGSNGALARVDLGVSIGVPPVVVNPAPPPVYYPSPPYYPPPIYPYPHPYPYYAPPPLIIMPPPHDPYHPVPRHGGPHRR